MKYVLVVLIMHFSLAAEFDDEKACLSDKARVIAAHYATLIDPDRSVMCLPKSSGSKASLKLK